MLELKKIRDPIHGFIHYSGDEQEIIDSSHFQRLRGIKQLALTCLVYPGAMHTRFEHSLGVMEMASRAFDALCSKTKNEEKLRRNFKSIGLTIKEARQLLRLTALFHDTGHLPFSHAAEKILPAGKSHEAISVAIVALSKRELDRRFYAGVSSHICELIKKNGLVPPELLILKKLISSQLDVDRADYLLRDSHHCGVEYGNFDYLRLFEMLCVIEGREGGLELAVDRGGVHSLESLILARYYMFAQVYFHRVRRIFDLYLEKYMVTWARTRLKNLMDVIKYDDQDVHATLLIDSKRKSGSQTNLASRIVHRKHHRVIFETGDCAEAADKRDVGKLHEQLRKQFSNAEFILDADAKGTIHRFYVAGDEELGEEFYVLSPYGLRPLTKESVVIAKLPKRFAVYRIYSEGNIAKLRQYRDFANNAWHDLSQGR
jgi:HD superfamily phosphohydrolase